MSEQHTVTVTVDRETRELLRREARYVARGTTDLDLHLERGERDRAIDHRDKQAWAIEVFDAVGWPQTTESDDDVDMTIAEGPLRAWLVELIEDTRAAIGENVIELRRLERDGTNDPYEEKWRKTAPADIERDIDDVERLEALQAQIRKGRAAALR